MIAIGAKAVLSGSGSVSLHTMLLLKGETLALARRRGGLGGLGWPEVNEDLLGRVCLQQHTSSKAL